MLSKEEFERAFDILKEQHDYLSSNMHYNYPFSIEMLENVQDCFDNLIKEHFELVEEYKDVRKELECYYEMMSNPQPYKFEDLKDGMWVWDKSYQEVCYIDSIVSKEKIYCEYLESHCSIEPYIIMPFEENRFFPVQMANVRCE